jgi:protein gp37
MATKTSIEWTEATWNPVTGCTKVSIGCQHCYAERLALRLRAAGLRNYRRGFQVTTHPHALRLPLKWKKPQMVFVNSMSDLFHEEVPIEFIQKVFDVMHEARWHCYQILTKRSGRLLELDPLLRWAPNIWMGVTVESADYCFRIDHLRGTHAAVKFLSLEPLLGPMQGLNLDGIDWVVVGGESGPGARPMEREWVLQIRDHCRKTGVPFFFKQWGGVDKKKAGRLLDGRTWSEMPKVADATFPLLASRDC